MSHRRAGGGMLALGHTMRLLQVWLNTLLLPLVMIQNVTKKIYNIAMVGLMLTESQTNGSGYVYDRKTIQ